MTDLGSSSQRRSIRLPAHDYATHGAYFVTISAHRHQLLFGTMHGRVQLNSLGQLIRNEWLKTPQIRTHVELDEFMVMPNHFHAIVWLLDSDQPATHPPTLGQVIAGFKSAVARFAKRDLGINNVWHRNYYERVIRDERELLATRKYIVDNPAAWTIDRLNPERTDDDTDDEPWMQ